MRFGRSTASDTIADSEDQSMIGPTSLLYNRTLSYIFRVERFGRPDRERNASNASNRCRARYWSDAY